MVVDGLRYRDYCMRYRPELPLVLKDLNMTIVSYRLLGVGLTLMHITALW